MCAGVGSEEGSGSMWREVGEGVLRKVGMGNVEGSGCGKCGGKWVWEMWREVGVGNIGKWVWEILGSGCGKCRGKWCMRCGNTKGSGCGKRCVVSMGELEFMKLDIIAVEQVSFAELYL